MTDDGNVQGKLSDTDAVEERIGGMTRREFTFGVGGAAALLALGCVKFAPGTALVRPPGGQDEAVMLGACIRCEKCYEVCPHRVIRLSHIEDSIAGMRSPEMVFENDYCDFCAEENGGRPLCVEVCPTRALQLPDGATAQTTVIGKAQINTDWCLAYNSLECRFCYDKCPYDAMSLDESGRPIVIADKCNGCGACECVCVSLMEGSISVGATSRAIVVKPDIA